MNSALAKSYELERKGLEFYISMAVKCTNPLARRTLFNLAEEEIKHMIKIDDVSLTVDKSGKWPQSASSFQASDIEIAIKGFFEQAGKEVISDGKDNADIMRKAMEFERKSYELYQDLNKKADSPAEKEFYAELMKQENSHYEALDNVYHYLTDSGNWFEKEESGVWSWMNL